jgi:tetratricopeptide (TPR) repeat protein
MKFLSETQFYELTNLSSTEPLEALKILSEYEKEYVDDENLQENLGGFLIDIGSALRDISVIQRGVNNIEQKREKSSGDLTYSQWYNLGNGYYALESAKRGPGYTYIPANTTMTQAKQCYRKALINSNQVSDIDKVELRVNYANSLAELGRSVEAINQYNIALQFNPEHPMALGSLGKALEKFAYIASDSRLLEDALQSLEQALTHDRLENSGYGYVRPEFSEYKQKIEGQLRQIKKASHSTHKMPQITTEHHKAFTDFCIKHSLFLNFCLKGHNCNHPYEDNISFSIITPINDKKVFHKLTRTINEMKEQYAIARLLLFEATHSPYQTKFYDELTPYNDLLDYSTYGIRPAKLKLSFEAAYNILDKIAFFINSYLGLGISEEAIGFFRIWKKQPKDNLLRQEITQLDNIHLYGLYDIARDLSKDGHLLHLKDMRDTLTHKYLVPHTFQDSEWYVTSDGKQYHLGYKELLDHTISLMQVVRAAVIYLVAFIEQEERKKTNNSQRRVVNIRGQIHKPENLNPEDSLI